ncbi:MAG: septal ring lytic transglycosylase RlpA family protein [Actinomycetota bacterium]|nr:septal ring lytic transglycosylase RlpA family protein [Actinomycetota bacterium]
MSYQSNWRSKVVLPIGLSTTLLSLQLLQMSTTSMPAYASTSSVEKGWSKIQKELKAESLTSISGAEVAPITTQFTSVATSSSVTLSDADQVIPVTNDTGVNTLYLPYSQRYKRIPPPPPPPPIVQSPTHRVVGVASWYGSAPGTCANLMAPFGTLLTITDLYSGAVAHCVVDDHGPYVGGRIVDLSPSVFSQLSYLGNGLIYVSISW